MARYALPFLCLIGLATIAIVAADNFPTIYVGVGQNLPLTTGKLEVGHHQDYDINDCQLILNNDTKITLKSQSYSSRYQLRNSRTCDTDVYKMNVTDVGKWTIVTVYTIKDEDQQKILSNSYNVKVRDMYEKKTAVPSKSVWVYPEQLVSVRFNEYFDNLKSCSYLDPQKMEYDLKDGSSANVQMMGHCGLKMKAKEHFGGKWWLIADLKNGTAFYVELEVNVNDPKDLEPQAMNLTFKRGEESFVSLKFKNQKPKMCYVEDPHGVKYPIQDGICHHQIDHATEYHEGLWKAYYGFEGMETLVQQNINVKMQDEVPTFRTSVSRSKNGDVNLLCQLRDGLMKFCSFVKPDGEILHMTVGVGNKKYEYYGNGSYDIESWITDHQSTMDCGVTIHNPDADDFGSWRCLIKSDKNRKVFGSVLKVSPSARSAVQPKSSTTAQDVYVKRGESYKVKCQTDEVLSYCWLRSPNGTVHSVVQAKDPKAPALKYDGEGLELGDCSAIVEQANDTHSGEWTCHMGVFDGPEIEAKLNVFVLDTHLMAVRDSVPLLGNEETVLTCRPLPGSGKVIEACRWVNPLGHGINVDRDGRYVTETGTTQCRLSIRVINFEEDVGSWSCYARFANSQEEEDVATMNVVYHSSSFGFANVLTLALCTSALVTISIGIFFIVVYKRRLAAMRDFDEKIILEKPSKFP